MTNLIILRRERDWEDAKWDDYFTVARNVDPEQAMRDAVEEFLLTEEGSEVIEQTSNDFNWGDAVIYVPESVWNNHGVKTLYEGDVALTYTPTVVTVDQDEVLIPSELIK